MSGQILDSFNAYGRHIRLTSTLAIGGVPMGRQVRSLMQGVEVLVATPGRLLDLVQSNGLKLGSVEFLVLDEADRMLDMGFINDIRKIVGKLPIKRQTLFFSATMPKDIAELAEAMLRDPARVAVTPVASTVERITQRIIQVDFAAKAGVLAQLLKQEPVDRALIFTRTKHGADKVVKGLAKVGIRADAIHGNKSQNNRERALAAFRSGEIRTLVATDIAARGIDVDGISHVVNFDLPNVPETYVHRIGRTARAGAEGVAISLIAGAEEMGYLRDIERLIKITLPREDRRTPGTRDRDAAPAAAPRPVQNRGGRSAPRAHGARAQDSRGHESRGHESREAMNPGDMTRRRAQKALAVPAVAVVIMPRRSRTGTSSRARRSRAARARPVKAKAFKASPSCIARAVRIPNPTVPIGRSASLDRSGDNHGQRRADPVRRTGDRNPPRRALPRAARRRARDRCLHRRQDEEEPDQDAGGRSGHDRNVALRPGEGPPDLPSQGRAPEHRCPAWCTAARRPVPPPLSAPATARKIAPDTPVSRAIADGCRPNQKIVHVRIVLDPTIE